MNGERLLAHYERIADAPDAIQRLRRFVLDLAVRGKLVPQELKDEPVSELLKGIAAERARLVKAGGIRREEIKAELKDTPPFELPVTWVWAPFGQFHQLVRGVTYSKSDVADGPTKNYVAILRANNIGSVLTHDDPVYVKRECVSADQFLRAGDFMIALSSGSKNLVGKAAFVPENFGEAFGGFCGAIRLFDQSIREFVRIYLKSDLYRDSISTGSRGIGINNLKKEVLSNSFFPLPPIAEQRRIVAKVDELMALCDRLEVVRAEREATRDKFTAASLARLNAPDPEAFRDDARFALDALPALTARADQIKQLRQTILNLAVRGKLVSQNPNDEPASELMKRIAAEKARMVKAELIPRQREVIRDLSRLNGGLPASWEPIALGEVCAFVTSGSRGWAEFYADSGPKFIRAQNIRFGKLKLDDLAFVRPPSNSEGTRTRAAEGDLLIVITGAGVTNPARLDRDLGEAYVSQHVGLVRLVQKQLSEWILLCLMAPVGGRSELVERAYGAGRPGLNLENIRTLSVPLPPLSEQRRIVAGVDHLMALCDRLETSLATAADNRRRLLDALLAEALAPMAIGANRHPRPVCYV